MHISANRPMRARTRSRYAAFAAFMTAALVIAALAASISGALADSHTKEISVNSSHENTDFECQPGQQIHWHFIINQIDKDEDAPSSISVTFENAGTVNVPLRDHPSSTAHYDAYTGPSDTMITATAVIYSEWEGNFNLSSFECSGTPTDPDPIPASAEVRKITDPAGSEAGWSFTLRKGGVDVETVQTTGTDYVAFDAELDEGSYEIVETPQGGWTQTGSEGCSFSVEFPDDEDETFQCTFTNQQDEDPPSAVARVQKVTIPEGSESGWEFDLLEDGTIVDSLTTTGTGFHAFNYDLVDGESYEIVETSQGGWNQTGTDGCSFTVDFPADDGETFDCTITNTQDEDPPGTGIIIEKVVQGEDHGQSFPFDAEGTDYEDFSLLNGQSNNQDLDEGDYSVTELVPDGWDLVSIVCDDEQLDSTAIVDPDNDTVDIDLIAGDHVTCTFTNVAQPGQINVTKVTDPENDPQSFTFNTTGTGYAGFDLTDGQTNNSGSLDAGTYTVVEVVPDDWNLTDIDCGDADTSAIANGVSIDLAPGETVDCTFTNEEVPPPPPDQGQIIITKQTDPDGHAQSFDFTATYGNFSLQDGQSNNSGGLDPDTYTVTESVPDDWNLEDISCNASADVDIDLNSNSVEIDLSADETVTCTFLNVLETLPIEDEPGRIVIIKETVDPSTQTFNFTGDLGSFPLADGQSHDSGDLNAGVYSISETVPDGWTLVSINCDDAVQSISNGVTIDLDEGETVTCTFLNEEREAPEESATLVIVKQIDGTSGQSFSFRGDLGNFSLTGPGSTSFGGLELGDYTVTEDVPDDWDLTSIDCGEATASVNGSSVTITLDEDGQTVTCTFLNTEDEDETLPVEEEEEEDDETLPKEDKKDKKKDHKDKKPKKDKSIPQAMPKTGSTPGADGMSMLGLWPLMVIGALSIVAGVGIEIRRRLSGAGHGA